MTSPAGTMEPSSSTAVDIGPDLNPNLNPSAKKSQSSFWKRLVNAANAVEEHLAEWFGLNQSKYQWAVDEFMERQLSGHSQLTPTPTKAVNELQTEPTSEQAMHRDTREVDDV